MSMGLIALGVVAVCVLFVIGIYNNLVKLRNNRENAFSNIDVQLKQRYDLIPNLVSSVKGYAAHEKELLENITKARTAAISATDINQKIAADNQLSAALSGLRVSVEAYPDLKANQNFQQLMTELSDIENKLAASRRFFNSSTKELNNAVQTFPSNILAGMFGFKKEPMFEVSSTERAPMDECNAVRAFRRETVQHVIGKVKIVWIRGHDIRHGSVRSRNLPVIIFVNLSHRFLPCGIRPNGFHAAFRPVRFLSAPVIRSAGTGGSALPKVPRRSLPKEPSVPPRYPRHGAPSGV